MCLGLTLGEMLIVLLVFSILAIMFFFSSNLAITKTKLSRVNQDQKTLLQALRSYESEYYSVPADSQGLAVVTHNPVSYLSRIPVDPFTPSSRAQEYGYFSDLSANYRWILVSVGPDGQPDIDRALAKLRGGSGAAIRPNGRRQLLMSDKDAQEFIIKYSYDPTNGASSPGDVITSYGQR
jgi:type II secretory pathway pseudopilin PulG